MAGSAAAVRSPRDRNRPARDLNRPAADRNRNPALAMTTVSSLALSRDLLAETAPPVDAREKVTDHVLNWHGRDRFGGPFLDGNRGAVIYYLGMEEDDYVKRK